MGLNPTPHGTIWRQPCSTCADFGLDTNRKLFQVSTSSMSSPGKVFRLSSNWATRSTACADPRQFLWVSVLRPYSPGGILNALALAHSAKRNTPSIHRLRLGLPGYLILFAPLAFVFQCQYWTGKPLSPLAFFSISTHFTATPKIPFSSPKLQFRSFKCHSFVKQRDFTLDFSNHLHTLYAQ